MDQYKCPTCSSWKKPGQLDDGDTESGEVLPLCPTCLGTGFSCRIQEFVMMKKKVGELRDKAYALQKGDLSKTIPPREKAKILALLNGELLAITRRAVCLVTPAKNSLANELIKSYCLPACEPPGSPVPV